MGRPITNGNSTITVYASDLHDLTPATISVTVDGTTPTGTAANTTTIENASNTMTDTAPPSDLTASPLLPNDTLPTLDCTNPNPNLRPADCLLQNATAFFPEQDITWENLDRKTVARFTVIGNLVLNGTVVEHSTGDPAPRDFRVGYADQDGNTITTLWIDEHGNLHLRGTLQEETTNLQPPPGSYAVMTRRSIYLAYADTTTGDLWVRGNVIPYRTTT
jgi:hypothetical protein